MATAMGEDDVASLLTKNLEQEKAALSEDADDRQAARQGRGQDGRVNTDRRAEAVRFGPPTLRSQAARTGYR